MFAAAIRYGRSNAAKHVRQQSYPVGYTPTILGYAFGEKNPWAAQFADTQTRYSESHVVLDFQAGRDVGLGLFGHNGSSTVNLGVRFAQFTSKSNIMFSSDPDWHFVPKYTSYLGQQLKIPNGQSYHNYYGHLLATRSFHGIGPSLSWNASAEVAGSKDQSELTFDWGINAALLFGRQKAQTHHQTTAQYHAAGGGLLAEPGRTLLYDNPATPGHIRSHSAVVPNVGGFAGLSFRAGDAKVSFGYRADFFFGAMDGGIDTRKTYDRNFYGPYATVSIGLGG
ncbi:MAG TPA: hypothetical protein VN682_18135 [Terriglobales bacterium]|nr:hypothetical protein [Terriglobales bacterium]